MSKPVVAIAYHSGYGHTKVVAEAVLAGIKEVDAVEGVLVPVEEVDAKWDVLDGASAIIFGVPIYMGNVSAAFQTFSEKTAKRWYEKKWQDKLAAGFVNSGAMNGDKHRGMEVLFGLSQQHGMVWVGLGLHPGNNTANASIEDLNRLGSFVGAYAQSNNDQGPDVAPPATDHRTAQHLGKRVAEAAVRWTKGA
ncbi:flavodoxin family protein [Xanthobacter tagetidis]|uniref:Flavodoxin family protein n=1 Tax=Xanthobacter tagetidis TaxID=60216 RepID=A0A3L6ZUS1_9HYPH|nr:flavodoxin family protein [Xanthobacter tagetidis]MBB6309858.1 multimeric flavodoxin WrbA [Xanthobacter tagetidis]RLP71569.1 flavodoxin family protein [Xanthobacter tagetidis]